MAESVLFAVLNRSHPVCSVVFDLAVGSVNNELASFLRLNAFPRSLDGLVLLARTRKHEKEIHVPGIHIHS